MVPNVAKSGHSFKGALAYYLHDKGAGTAERVAWTASRNMATDDPQLAMRVMIATAQQAEQLKAAAGVAATGRKSTKSVYAYSLAWHPDEAGQIDRAEMMAAVESSLIAIGAEGLQALIVCHQDEPHPHVHIVVNRVDPDTGRLFVPKNDFRQLDAWALAYRERRGEHLKYCPKRAETRDQKAQEPRPKPTAPKPALPSKGAVLAALAAETKVRHQKEWDALAAVYKARKDAAWKHRPNFKAIAAQHRAETRPDWSAFGKEQAEERRNFRHNERLLRGIFHNAKRAVMAGGMMSGQRGFLTAVFRFVLDAAGRQQGLEQHLTARKADMAARSKAQLDAKIAAAKKEHADRLERARLEYQAKRDELKARHDLERGKIREGWKEFYAERDQAQPRRGRAWSRPTPAQRREKDRRNSLDQARAARSEAQEARADRLAIAQSRGPFRERPHADRFTLPPKESTAKPEPTNMKEAFDSLDKLIAAGLVHPSHGRTAPIPAPQPTPMGAAPAAVPRQDVPKVDRAADFAQTPKGQEVIARQAPKAAPDALRTAAAEPFKPSPASPAQPAPASSPTKDIWSKAAEPKQAERPKDIWGEKAKPDADRRARDRSKDRDFDHDR